MMGIEYSLKKRKLFKKHFIAGISVFENEEGRTQCLYSIDYDMIKKLRLKINIEKLEDKVRTVYESCVFLNEKEDEWLIKPITVRACAGNLKNLGKEFRLKPDTVFFKPEWEDDMNEIR